MVEVKEENLLMKEPNKEYIEDIKKLIKFTEKIYKDSCDNRPRKYFLKDYKIWKENNKKIHNLLLRYCHLYMAALQNYYFPEEKNNYKTIV